MAKKQIYRIGVVSLCAAMVLASCGSVTSRDKRVRYDGVPFKTSSKAVNKKVSRADFEVTVKNALRSEKGARAAALHEGTTYCIEYYGTSDIIWAVDPLNTDQPLQLDGSNAVYTGMCNA